MNNNIEKTTHSIEKKHENVSFWHRLTDNKKEKALRKADKQEELQKTQSLSKIDFVPISEENINTDIPSVTLKEAKEIEKKMLKANELRKNLERQFEDKLNKQSEKEEKKRLKEERKERIRELKAERRRKKLFDFNSKKTQSSLEKEFEDKLIKKSEKIEKTQKLKVVKEEPKEVVETVIPNIVEPKEEKKSFFELRREEKEAKAKEKEEQKRKELEEKRIEKETAEANKKIKEAEKEAIESKKEKKKSFFELRREKKEAKAKEKAELRKKKEEEKRAQKEAIEAQKRIEEEKIKSAEIDKQKEKEQEKKDAETAKLEKKMQLEQEKNRKKAEEQAQKEEEKRKKEQELSAKQESLRILNEKNAKTKEDKKRKALELKEKKEKEREAKNAARKEKLKTKFEEEQKRKKEKENRDLLEINEKKEKETRLKKEKEQAINEKKEKAELIRKAKEEQKQKLRSERKTFSEKVVIWWNNISFVRDSKNKRELQREALLLDVNGTESVRSEEKIMYKYVAKNAETGKVETNYLPAYSKLEVHSYLLAEGYEVYEIVPQSGKITGVFGVRKQTKLKPNELDFFLTQLATLLRSGITLVESIKILSKQASKNTVKNLYKSLVYELSMGENLSEAMDKQGAVFPRLLINMVKTAELTGDLPETLDDMAKYYKETAETRKQMASALAYPAVVLVFAIAVLIYIMVSVIPQFVGIYESLDAKLPGITIAVIKVSNFLQGYWIWVVLGLIAFVIVFIVLFKTIKVFKTVIQTMYMNLPIIGNIVIYNEVTMFTKTFASLLNHNVYITDCMEVLGKITNNEIYKMLIFDTITNLAKGESISNSFKNHWAFPTIAYEMILTGEKTGQLGEMMDKVSVYYQQQHKSAVASIKAFIEPVMIIVLALIVGVVLLSVVVPMFDMYQNIGSM